MLPLLEFACKILEHIHPLVFCYLFNQFFLGYVASQALARDERLRDRPGGHIGAQSASSCG